jgi:succinate dehydrogenase cytochrome b subunit
MSVQPQQYVTYRGKGGQWSWILHRLTGLGVFAFLFLHIIDTALIGWGPDAYNTMMAVYRQPFFRIGEALLAGAVLYHALNGVRICIIDFWPGATSVHRKLVLAVIVLFAVIYIPSAIYMLRWVVR